MGGMGMEELDRALADITAIRSQLARGTEFRGYGPMTVAATGFVAVGAAAIQALWLPDPASDLLAYLGIWVATAAISVLLIGIEMVARSRRIHSGLADAMIHAATEQFIPAGVAGALAFALRTEAYIAMKDGGDSPLVHCPKCGEKTFLTKEWECAACGAEPEHDCARCGTGIPPEELDSAPFCGYCDYMMNKDD